MKSLRQLAVSGLLLLLALPAAAEQQLASALPVLQQLNSALLKDTPVKAVYLPPKRLPVARIASWTKQKSRQAIAELGPVTAFATVESIWPKHSLYPYLREQNIQVIPVDAAVELTPSGSRVRVAEQQGQAPSYFWLEPDNLITMSQILARDYARIWPDSAEQIRTNQATLQRQIASFALELDQLLLDHEVESICLQNAALMPLASASFLPIEPLDSCGGGLVIAERKRGSEVAKGVWLVDGLSRPFKGDLAGWLEGNLQALKAAF